MDARMHKNAAFQLYMYFTQAQGATGKKAQIISSEVYRIGKEICKFCCSDIQLRFSIMNER